MREMKDSGVEWIGEIPKDWEICRLKFLSRIGTGNKDTINRVENGKYPFFVRSKTIERIDSYSYDGEAILTAGDGDIGKIFHYINGKFDYHQRVYNISDFNKVLGKYLYFYMSENFSREIAKYNAKTTVESLRLPWLLNFNVILPPLDIQHRIADYLDRKCSKIDEIIEKEGQVIEKLKAYKQSVITEAVTKGLNPDVPMKDSGVEFIGDIPKTWCVKQLRYIGKCQNGISKSGEHFGSGLPFVSYSDVYKNYELPQNASGLVESTEAEQENYSVKRGDVFFTRTSETIEEVGLTSVCLSDIEKATFAGFLIRVRPFENAIEPLFAKYYFRSEHHRRFIVKEMNLVTRASLGQELLKRLPVLLPSQQEQLQIADYLERKCCRVEDSISHKQSVIEKLTVYKKSLIYEVVTGKKEV